MTTNETKQDLLDYLEGYLLVTGEVIEFFDVTSIFVEFPEDMRDYANKINPNKAFKPLLIEEPTQRMEHWVNYLNINPEQFTELMLGFRDYCKNIERMHVYSAFYYTLKILVREDRVSYPLEDMNMLGEF